MGHRMTPVHVLQSLTGHLNFAASVVPGRAFNRSLYDTLRGYCTKSQKPYWHVRLSAQARLDLQVWQQFLQQYNGVTMFKPPVSISSWDINLYADAAQSLGFGVVFGDRWTGQEWPDQWKQFNIATLELFAIVFAVLLWQQDLRDKYVVFHTDSMAARDMVNNQTSQVSHNMVLIRALVLALLNNNITLQAVHISGCKNVLSDKISRFQVSESLLLTHGMRLQPEKIPPSLEPSNWTL